MRKELWEFLKVYLFVQLIASTVLVIAVVFKDFVEHSARLLLNTPKAVLWGVFLMSTLFSILIYYAERKERKK